MRELYAERRVALADALNDEVPSLRIELKPGGMHLLARLPREVGDVKLVNRLKDAGMAPSPLSICGMERSYAPGLVIGFTNVEPERRVRLPGHLHLRSRIIAKGNQVHCRIKDSWP